MTPSARVAAAIEVLDAVIAGGAAEQALTSWARGSRFAGSKDRSAVRDHVYDVLRRKASLSVAGGTTTGRGLMIALLKMQGLDLSDLFSGQGYAPESLTVDEQRFLMEIPNIWDQVDVPEWLWPHWTESLGAAAGPSAMAQQDRADVYLRINKRVTTISAAIAALEKDGVAAQAHATVTTCLRVCTNPRRIKSSRAYLDGLVEIQDAASQAAVLRLQPPSGVKVLDYCAGGGGKSLAIAALHDCHVTAHDIVFDRMKDIGPRAERAGVAISKVKTDALPSNGPFDLVLCDAPCSGSGTWRRTPDAKWRLDRKKINDYNSLQSEVLSKSAQLTGRSGQLAYMTCSVLNCENEDIVKRFLADHANWKSIEELRLNPGPESDGFYLNLLQRRD